MAVLKVALRASLGGDAVLDFWLLGEAKAQSCGLLFEYFDAVTLIIPATISVPGLPDWVGVHAFDQGMALTTIRSAGHGDLRWRGCVGHLKTADIYSVLRAHGREMPRRASRWDVEQQAFELPLSAIKAAVLAVMRSRMRLADEA